MHSFKFMYIFRLSLFIVFWLNPQNDKSKNTNNKVDCFIFYKYLSFLILCYPVTNDVLNSSVDFKTLKPLNQLFYHITGQHGFNRLFL